MAVTAAAEMTSAVKKKNISFIFVFDSSPIFLGKKKIKKIKLSHSVSRSTQRSLFSFCRMCAIFDSNCHPLSKIKDLNFFNSSSY